MLSTRPPTRSQCCGRRPLDCSRACARFNDNSVDCRDCTCANNSSVLRMTWTAFTCSGENILLKYSRNLMSEHSSGGMFSINTVVDLGGGIIFNHLFRRGKKDSMAFSIQNSAESNTSHTRQAWTQYNQFPTVMFDMPKRLKGSICSSGMPPKNQCAGPMSKHMGTPIVAQIFIAMWENSIINAASKPTWSSMSSMEVHKAPQIQEQGPHPLGAFGKSSPAASARLMLPL
mmetsp:Transcript_6911/g.19610  ORF Transcript_6911/g.19610 Transcript_6911/m.19610 type:complete len:230 (-) Transcript_6911:454-1143(-)